MTRTAAGMALVATMIFGKDMVFGQEYPNKPIRIVTAAIGGGTDYISRQIAQEISGPLGQPVVIDNRPSGVIPGDTVSKAAPDGYTLLGAGNNVWMGQLLEKFPYDPVPDLTPISLTARSIQVLVVHPSLPVKSAKELIALAKAHPSVLNYGSTGVGSANHLAAELFKAMAGLKIVRVNYKATPLIITNLIAGEIQLTFGGSTVVIPHVGTGRLRALAVTSAQPSSLVPGLPTVAATGLPGYAAAFDYAFFAPTKTPAAIINRLSQEIGRALTKSEVKERFFAQGHEAISSTPEAAANSIKSDITIWGKLIKDSGMRVE